MPLPSDFRAIASTLAAAAALLFSAGAHAQALTLTFDALSAPSGTLAAGVQLQHTSNTHFVVSGAGYLVEPAPAGKFLAYYGLSNQSETLSLAPGTSGTFALLSLDLAGMLGDGGGTLTDQLSIQITGTKLYGGMVSTSQPLALTPGRFTHYDSSYFAGFTGLTSVQFSGIGFNYARYVGVDNIALNISPVPEPETYVLLLVGLGLVLAAPRAQARGPQRP
ncbi:PEP-CTERM sorting domain-containing protein [Rhodoferax sp. TBRC 17660]|uniref:PEP-CTERM sorting domain-containing protein n=1 Tax=Rhodoferax potami TaxID=3068338 RepID=A0ABU3KPE4_9BURK|nr:PEP-CTERM sorting domain-containing protein [Rhodoferax sp. TBRC 17660]MDT7519664.1 PEP-CTERM sorting domain-containing protein [Rhodoferax sp. TBRC 17660]